MSVGRRHPLVKRTELCLRYPKRLFEGASERMLVFTSKRDYVGSLFLRRLVRIATALHDSLVMGEKHRLLGFVMIRGDRMGLCPLLAQSGHPSLHRTCLLLRLLLVVKRTWPIALQMSASDPKRT